MLYFQLKMLVSNTGMNFFLKKWENRYAIYYHSNGTTFPLSNKYLLIQEMYEALYTMNSYFELINNKKQHDGELFLTGKQMKFINENLHNDKILKVSDMILYEAEEEETN